MTRIEATKTVFEALASIDVRIWTTMVIVLATRLETDIEVVTVMLISGETALVTDVEVLTTMLMKTKYARLA